DKQCFAWLQAADVAQSEIGGQRRGPEWTHPVFQRAKRKIELLGLTSEQNRVRLPTGAALNEVANGEAFRLTLQNARDPTSPHDIADRDTARIGRRGVDPGAHGGID